MIEDGVDYCDGCGWYRPECKCRPASSLSSSPTPDTTAARARAEDTPDGPWGTGVKGENWQLVILGYPCQIPMGAGPGAALLARFIAHARTDVPALCDALDEARSQLAQSTARVQELEGALRTAADVMGFKSLEAFVEKVLG